MYINVLGDLTATRDDEPLDLGGRRQRAVLALLVLARGETVSVDRLVDAVWGDQPPPAAVAALQSYVSHLRRRLEPDRGARSRGAVIASRGAGYAVLLEPTAVDAWRFEAMVRDPGPDPVARLSEALALWRGAAYAEYAAEPWAEAEATRLNELREVARDQLAAARLARGEAAVLVPELETLVAAAPLREERWRLLVLALYRANRQGDALAALRRARRVLSDELGVEPGPALRSLESEVLAQSSALSPPLPMAVSPPLTKAVTSDLVDRDRELEELNAAVAEALGGQARLVLVEGPAGIGKTRLLTEARRTAAGRGARVLGARGSRLEKEYGFGAIRQLFETAARDTPGALDGPAAPAASVFDLDGAGEGGGQSVLHGLYWLTVHLSRAGPIVLAVDDLQWCDSASLRFLAYLVRRVEGLPVLVIATLRTGEPHDDEAVLAELAADPITTHLRPAPLTEPGVADLARQVLGAHAEDAFVRACHRTTSGNPLLLRQLLQALRTEQVPPDAAHAGTVTAIGSRAISSLVLMRLARLSAASTAVATAIAVLGSGAALPTVAVLAGVDEAEAAAAVAALARAEVLRDEYPLSFVHPLVADAVYRDLAPGRRQLEHGRAARVLADAGAAPEQIAAQLLQVPPRGDAWVVDVLRAAARRARDRAAPEAAVASLTRALQEPPDAAALPGVLLELGHAEAISDAAASITHLRQAYEASTDPAVRADLALTLGRILVFVGEPGSATRFAHDAAAALPAGLDDDRQGLLATERISGYLHDLEPSAWRTLPPPAVTGTGIGARMLSVALAWEAAMDATDRGLAVRLARFGVAEGDLLNIDTGLLWVIAGQVLDLCDEDSGPLWTAGLHQATRRGDMFTALGMNLWRGYVEWRRGDLREARQALAAGNEVAHAWGEGGIASGYGESFLLEVLLDQGDLAACRTFLEQVRPHHRITEGARMFGEAEARLLTAEGRFREALTAQDAVLRVMSTIDNPAWRPWRSVRAAALAGLSRTAEALELLDEEVALARAWGAARPIGRALRLRGELRGGEPGLADLREAADRLDAGNARIDHARALLALGIATPDRDEAVTALRQAVDLAATGGADALYASAVAALTARGVAPPAPPEPVATLSATERRILDRHLGGVDEREIAEALFLTPRSVRAALESMRARLGGLQLRPS
ncbi:BTAD domain-containing putative transcriptional regulator [Dactylosporangium sp. CA-139066]|uniref:BTAD domain-containing putative transcriptional regulator n=1 Tax=Dactylosporangium sp. CA-139066 TaxID=3239930 RepID=UPI003D8C0D3E